MTERKDNNNLQGQNDEISLKDLVLKIQDLVSYLLLKWVIILIGSLLCGALFLVYAIARKTNYIATLSFIVEEQGASGGSLGAVAGIAAQFGFNLGGLSSSGGFFEGDNIIEFLKSRSMIDRTLLTTVEIDGKKDLLVNRYVEYNNLRQKWANNERLKNIQFRDTTGFFLQDSLMSGFYKSILKRNLVIRKPDKKFNILVLEMDTPDESFSKAFAETLIDNASDFYIETRTQKALENLTTLTRQVDSVRKELDKAIGGVAAATDANPNPNRAFQSLRVGSQMRTVDVQANSAIYAELVKNQELARMTLNNEKPVIQLLDKPILPLENDRIGKITALIMGSVLGGFLICLFLIIRRIYQKIMAGDLS